MHCDRLVSLLVLMSLRPRPLTVTLNSSARAETPKSQGRQMGGEYQDAALPTMPSSPCSDHRLPRAPFSGRSTRKQNIRLRSRSMRFRPPAALQVHLDGHAQGQARVGPSEILFQLRTGLVPKVEDKEALDHANALCPRRNDASNQPIYLGLLNRLNSSDRLARVPRRIMMMINGLKKLLMTKTPCFHGTLVFFAVGVCRGPSLLSCHLGRSQSFLCNHSTRAQWMTGVQRQKGEKGQQSV